MPDPTRLQCRHIFTDGHRCGSPCLRREPFCFYHHTARPPKPRTPLHRPRRPLPPPRPRRPQLHPGRHRPRTPAHRPLHARFQTRRPAPLRSPDRRPQPPQRPFTASQNPRRSRRRSGRGPSPRHRRARRPAQRRRRPSRRRQPGRSPRRNPHRYPPIPPHPHPGRSRRTCPGYRTRYRTRYRTGCPILCASASRKGWAIEEPSAGCGCPILCASASRKGWAIEEPSAGCGCPILCASASREGWGIEQRSTALRRHPTPDPPNPPAPTARPIPARGRRPRYTTPQTQGLKARPIRLASNPNPRSSQTRGHSGGARISLAAVSRTTPQGNSRLSSATLGAPSASSALVFHLEPARSTIPKSRLNPLTPNTLRTSQGVPPHQHPQRPHSPGRYARSVCPFNCSG